MAQRFGGEHSPAGKPSGPKPKGAYHKAKVKPVGARSNMLFVPPVILAATSINDGAVGMAIGLAGAGLLILSVWLLREGLTAEAAYNDRKIARRPGFPRKIIAAVLCGFGAAFAAYSSEPGILAPLIFFGFLPLAHLPVILVYSDSHYF